MRNSNRLETRIGFYRVRLTHPDKIQTGRTAITGNDSLPMRPLPGRPVIYQNVLLHAFLIPPVF